MIRFIVSTLAQRLRDSDGRFRWFTSLDTRHYLETGQRRYRGAESLLFCRPFALRHLKYQYRAKFWGAPEMDGEIGLCFFAPQEYEAAIVADIERPIQRGLEHPLHSMQKRMAEIFLFDRAPELHKGAILAHRREFSRVRYDVWTLAKRPVDPKDVCYFGGRPIQNIRLDFLFDLLVKPPLFDKLSACPMVKVLSDEDLARRTGHIALDRGDHSISAYIGSKE